MIISIAVCIILLGLVFGKLSFNRAHQKNILESVQAENAGLRENLRMYLKDEKVPLSQSERIMIRGALKHSGFIGWVQEPKTKHRYRILYRELLLKIKRSIHR